MPRRKRKKQTFNKKTHQEIREQKREAKQKKEKLHAHKKILNPDDLICPWCLKNSSSPNDLKTRNTSCAIWLKPRKELGNWAEGTIMCHFHEIRVYPDLWFETLRIILDSIDSIEGAEKNRIYYLERDKYQSIKAIVREELKEREQT